MKNLNLSRRGFLKVVAASATAASFGTGALVPAEAAPLSHEGVQKIRGCCRACGKMECGVWISMKNGKAIKIEGDKTCFTSEGNCCSKSQASIQSCYHPDRLMYPMKRTKPKGGDPGWVRISWDEALDTSAKKLMELVNKYGPHTIRVQHGTSRCYAYMHHTLVRALGGANHGNTAGQVCKGPRIAAGAMTCFPGAFWMALGDGVDVYVQWATATELSNYDDSAAVTIDRAKKAKAFICVGPIQQNLGSQADVWLPLRPGTDGAMAMAWMHVIIKNKMYDEKFVKQWSNAPFLYSKDNELTGFRWEYAQPAGMYPLDIKTRLIKESDMVQGGSPLKFAYYDKKSKKIRFFDADPSRQNHLHGWDTDYKNLDVALDGTYDVKLKNGRTIKASPSWTGFIDALKDYTPAKVAKICEVDAKQIEKAALIYGKYLRGGGIHHNLAIEHNGNAVQTCRNLLTLAALMGNIDDKGGHRGGEATWGQWALTIPTIVRSAKPDITVEQRSHVAGSERYPLLPWVATLGSAAIVHDMCSITDMILTGKPYPVRAQISMTGTHMHAGNAVKNWEAHKTLDFMFASELWFSPSVELADILVPATHWLETKTQRPSQGASGGLGYMPAPVAPRGECKPDEWIVMELAKRMKVPWWSEEMAKERGTTQWPTHEQLYDRCFEPIGHTEKSFAELFQRDGWQDYKKLNPKGWGTYRRYENGELRSDKKIGFATPTMKFEFLVTILESYPKGPGEEWPVYHEPPLSPYTERGAELTKQYPLIFNSGSRVPVYFHNEHRNVPFLRELYPVPRLKLNSNTAKEYGVKDGDWVWIENHKGKIRMCAEIFEGMRDGLVSGDHLWWYPELPAPEHGCHLSNINVLVDEYAQDPYMGASNLRGFPCKIYPAKEGAPEGIILSAQDPRLKRWLPKA